MTSPKDTSSEEEGTDVDGAEREEGATVLLNPTAATETRPHYV